MKKILSVTLCSSFLFGALALAVAAKPAAPAYKESTADVMNEVAGMKKQAVRRVVGDSTTAVSKTYAQYGVYEGKYVIRFATAVKGDLESVSYFRSIAGGEVVEKPVSEVYKGIAAEDKVYYYDGNDITEDASFAGQYYWACYTIAFSDESKWDTKVSAYLSVKAKDVVEPVTTVVKETSVNQELNPVVEAPYDVAVEYGENFGAGMNLRITWKDAKDALVADSKAYDICADAMIGETNYHLTTNVVNPSIAENTATIYVAFSSADFMNGVTTYSIEATTASGEVYKITYAIDDIKVDTTVRDLKVEKVVVVKHKVTFSDPEGGNQYDPIEVREGKTFGELPAPTRDGYSFDGWYDAAGNIATSGSVMGTADVVLTARWVAARAYDVKAYGGVGGAWLQFDISWNDAKYAMNGVPSMENLSASCKRQDNGAEVVWDGFVGASSMADNKASFGLGFKSADFQGAACVFEIEILTTSGNYQVISFVATPAGEKAWVVSDLTITEKAAVSHSVSFQLGYEGGEAIAPLTILEGKKLGDLPDVKREGFTFLGWFNESGEQVTSATVMGTSDMVLTAHWEEGQKAYDVKAYGGVGGAWLLIDVTWNDANYALDGIPSNDNITASCKRVDNGMALEYVGLIDTFKVEGTTASFGLSFKSADFQGAACEFSITLKTVSGESHTVTFVATPMGQKTWTTSNVTIA